MAKKTTRIKENERIAELYKNGMPIKDICRECSVEAMRIYRVVRAEGLPLRRPPEDPEHKRQTEDMMAQLYVQGVSCAEICRRCNASSYRLQKVASERGLSAAREESLRKEAERKEKEILKLYADGYTAQQISRKTGIYMAKVYEVLKAGGAEQIRPRVTAQRKEDILRLRAEGMTVSDVCSVLHVSPNTVVKVCREARGSSGEEDNA